jgi:tungstate transport system ATP-binding protein
MIAIHASTIRKSYNNRLILDLDLRFEGTGLHIILGSNGCGKSTLLKLLALLDVPDKGRILLRKNGELLSHDRTGRHSIVLAPRPDGLFNQTAENNVHYGLKLRKLPQKERSERVREVLAAVGLSALGRANALTLSSGEKQRLCMAMAIAVNPDVILLDEPTSSLDPHNVEQVENIIVRMKEERRMVILVTHNISQARRLADTVTFMGAGGAVSQRPAKEFFSVFDKDGLDGYL